MQQLYAIFGNPVSHSKSPLMHNLCFTHFKLKNCYTRVLLEDPNALRKTFFDLKLSGANITVPHKEAAFEACDVIDEDAQNIGAINTIVDKNGVLYGYNTDAPGFMQAISGFKKDKVLILGAGGTAKAIASIMSKNALDVTVLNRSKKRLDAFGFCKTSDWQNFTPSGYDLIINTTSAGLSDENLPLDAALLKELMQQSSGAVDVIYGKKTPFLALAQSCGLRHIDGADMLLYQGVLAFELFTQGAFSRNAITKVMRKAFVL
jgi:shikimate dehydrogenase